VAEFDHWMKFHIGDYLGDTMHLTTFQHGIYVLLIMHAFKHGSLPVDEAALRRIAKVPSVMLWRKTAPPVLALWHLENGVLRHTRIDSTRDEAKRISGKRQSAGKSGASKRWKMANANGGDSNCQNFAMRLPSYARAGPQPKPDSARDSAGSALAVPPQGHGEQARADTHLNPPSAGRTSETEATHTTQPPAGLRPTAATRGSLDAEPATPRPFRIIDGRRQRWNEPNGSTR
jgi:uncharacterized protein YdaU (DUF1376 family)